MIGASCSHKSTYIVKESSASGGYVRNSDKFGEPTTLPMNPPLKIMDVPSSAMPKATAFRMSGDYADNVAITVGSNGNLQYFPDPKDITADSKPINLGNGWWLNRQGIGYNSVFTKYTFAEYAELPAVPTIEQLKNSILPGAKVTQFIQLPYSIGDASDHIAEIKEYLKDK